MVIVYKIIFSDSNDSLPFWTSNMYSTAYDLCFKEHNNCPNTSVTSCSYSNSIAIQCSKTINIVYCVNYFLLYVADTSTNNNLDIQQNTCANVPGKSYVYYSKCYITLYFANIKFHKIVSVRNSQIKIFSN